MQKLKRLLFLQNFTANCIVIFPLYSIMFADRGHLSIPQINILFAIWVATALIAEIPTGIIADRYSRKTLLVVAQLLKGLAYFCWLVSPHFVGFAVGFVLSGVGYALESGALQAFIYDELSAKNAQKQYAKILTLTTTAAYLGMFVAYGVVTMLISHKINYALLLIVSFGMNLVAAGIMAAIPHVKQTHEETPKKHLQLLAEAGRFVIARPLVWRIVLWLGVIMGLRSWFEEYMPLHYRTASVPTRWIPVALMCGLALYISTNWIAHRLTATRAFMRTMLYIASCLLLMATAFVHGVALVVLGSVLCMMIWRWLQIIFDVDLQDNVPGHIRATTSSIAAFLSEIIGIGVPLIFAALSKYYGGAHGVSYLALGALIVWPALLGLSYMFVRTRPNNRTQTSV